MKRRVATITIDLSEDGIQNIQVTAASAEDREAAIERLRRCLPFIELLESGLKTERVGT